VKQKAPDPEDVDAYIAAAPSAAQARLRELRDIVRSTAPSATEKISYGMPSYEYRGVRLVYFAGYKNHVGLYSLVHVDGHVPAQLKQFVDSRSTLQFPLDRPLPGPAIRDALLRRMRENEGKEQASG
jgi:uncharacterized protein YdhG (YjbR/CyaY superfamily)